MARGRPRKFDKDKALEVALKLFWAHGYEGTSVALLAETMGINVPSLYSAFGNKEKLFLQAVEYYSQMAGPMYHESFKKKTAREVAQAILDAEVKLVTQKEYPDGCLMIQGALTTSPESEGIRKMMADMRRMAEKWIKERFQRAKEEGNLPAHADPAALACYIMTLNSGLAVQAKSGASKKELQAVVKVAMNTWPSN